MNPNDNRNEKLAAQFPRTEVWEDKYRYIIQKGKALPDLPEEERLDKFLVKGCQSRMWLVPHFDGKTIHFKADSDAAIVKGIVALVLEFYQDLAPETILSQSPSFLDELGIREHLSMSRRNGLSQVLKQIQLYAAVFKAMAAPRP